MREFIRSAQWVLVVMIGIMIIGKALPAEVLNNKGLWLGLYFVAAPYFFD